jgi:hypothetical protein
MAKTPATSKPPKSKGPERRGYASGLSDLTRKLASPALRRHGFAEGALVARWEEIVGPHFAEVTLPLKLGFALKSRTGGTLHIQIEGPMATQFQHIEDLVIERVNQFFGYAAVARLRLTQGPVPAPTRRRLPQTNAGPPPKEVESMPDGPLKSALIQLAATFSVDKQA